MSAKVFLGHRTRLPSLFPGSGLDAKISFTFIPTYNDMTRAILIDTDPGLDDL